MQQYRANVQQTASVVLIAEDDAGMRAFLKEIVEADNLAAVEVVNREGCLLACQQHESRILILSEHFPGARDLCRDLRSLPKPSNVQILVVYESQDHADAETFGDDYLVKPLRAPTLLHRIYALLRQQALEQEIDFQGEILSQLADAVVAVDSNSNVIYWNDEAERMYGIRADEILGQPLDHAYRIEGYTPEQRNVVTTTARAGNWRGEGVHVTRSGERIEVEVAVRALRNEANFEFGYITVVRNIGERKRMERALRDEREFSEVLRETAAALTRTLDPQGVMRLLLDHLGRVVPHRSANIMMLEGDKAHVAFTHGYTAEEEANIGAMTLPVYDLPTFQQMLSSSNQCLIPDTEQSNLWTQMDLLAWVKSYMGMSIRAYDHVIGFLNIELDVPNAFTSLHAERLRIFADQAAIAIENAQLYDAIYRDAVEMRALHRATAFIYGANLSASENLTDLCAKVADVVVSEFGKVDCGVMLVDDGTLERVARAGMFQVNPVQTLYLDGPGLVPAAVRLGQTIYVPDVSADQRYVVSNPATVSELVVPLRSSQGVIGALDLQSTRQAAFDDHDLRLLEVFAERAATAIDNVKLYNEVRRYAEELEQRVNDRTSELNRVKERVEAILNHSSDAILLVRRNGVIQQGNRAFDMMFGYRGDEAFGQPLTLLADEAHRDALEQALTRCVEKNNPERLEIVALRLNGLIFDADVTLSPVNSSPQAITGVVCSMRDISRRKQLENELRDALHKEREVNEMKSRFIARASHEFRTPLAVILTSSDLLRNYGNRMSAEQREEKLSRLQKEVRSLALMLDDLLTISKGEELKQFAPELVDLQSLAREVAREIIDGVGSQHHIVVECQGNCISVYADSKLIERIVTNLLSNAVKYSPIGSTIQVMMTCDTTKVVITVADEGIGIPENDRDRLFEAFHRARNVEHISGTGLRTRHRQAGGRASRRRSDFHQRGREGHRLHCGVAEFGSERKATMKKILVVEDAQSLRKDILEMLGFEGFQAIGAENGLVGVQRAREYMPDLIICDIMMPEMDGYEVLEELRKDSLTATIPFIFLTARTDRMDMRQGMELGADDFLTKPFHAAELLATVRTRLRKREVLDEVARRQVAEIRENIMMALPHELRTPLNVILGFSDLLMTDCELMDVQRIGEMSRHINLSALRLYRLIENFLVYTHTELMRTDSRQLESIKNNYVVYPKSTIEHSAVQKAQQCERDADLELEVYDVEAIGIGEDYLRKVVEELVDNACKFSIPGTPVSISTAVEDDSFVLSVTNQGRGMTPEQIASVGAYMQFERRIHEQQGAGLGLVICKRLAELHGGELSVSSVPGAETTVRVRMLLKQVEFDTF